MASKSSSKKGVVKKESAKKELRKAKKRRVLNVRRQKTMKDALKNIKKLILL